MPDVAAISPDLAPDHVCQETEGAVAGLEVSHQGHEGVALLDDVDEARIDLDGAPAHGLGAVQREEPAIGGDEVRPPGHSRSLDHRRGRRRPQVRGMRVAHAPGEKAERDKKA